MAFHISTRLRIIHFIGKTTFVSWQGNSKVIILLYRKKFYRPTGSKNVCKFAHYLVFTGPITIRQSEQSSIVIEPTWSRTNIEQFCHGTKNLSDYCQKNTIMIKIALHIDNTQLWVKMYRINSETGIVTQLCFKKSHNIQQNIPVESLW